MNKIKVKFIKCEDMLYLNEHYRNILNYYTTCEYYKKYIFASTKELTDLERIAVGKYYCHVNNESEEYRTEIKVVSLEEFRKMRGATYVLIQEKETDKEYKAYIE